MGSHRTDFNNEAKELKLKIRKLYKEAEVVGLDLETIQKLEPLHELRALLDKLPIPEDIDFEYIKTIGSTLEKCIEISPVVLLNDIGSNLEKSNVLKTSFGSGDPEIQNQLLNGFISIGLKNAWVVINKIIKESKDDSKKRGHKAIKKHKFKLTDTILYEDKDYVEIVFEPGTSIMRCNHCGRIFKTRSKEALEHVKFLVYRLKWEGRIFSKPQIV